MPVGFGFALVACGKLERRSAPSGYRVRVNHHRHVLTPVIALALLSALVAGCSPSPTPTPTPTAAFATEEEAFAAAEETYRAYIDASNTDRSRQESASSLEFLTGEALEAEIASMRDLEAAGVRIEGVSRVLNVVKVTGEFEAPVAALVVRACLDISMARAIDASGQDVTAEGRSDIYAVDVSLTGTSDRLLIASLKVATDVPC